MFGSLPSATEMEASDIRISITEETLSIALKAALTTYSFALAELTSQCRPAVYQMTEADARALCRSYLLVSWLVKQWRCYLGTVRFSDAKIIMTPYFVYINNFWSDKNIIYHFKSLHNYTLTLHTCKIKPCKIKSKTCKSRYQPSFNMTPITL